MQRVDVLLVTEFAPKHSGHGGHVYPYFLLQQLKAAGLVVRTLYVGDGAGHGAPFSRDADMVLPDWLRIGPYALSKSPKDWARYGLAPIWPVLRRLKRQARRQAGPGGAASAGHARQAPDDGIPGDARHRLAALVQAEAPGVVIVNLPYLLPFFPPAGARDYRLAVLCHDVVHERARMYADAGWPQDFRVLTAAEEGRLLGMADLVVAISDEDAAAFRQLADTRVIACLPPMYRHDVALAVPMPAVDGRLRCGFIGSAGPHNTEAMQWLLDAWAGGAATLGGAELIIAGSVAEAIEGDVPRGVSVLGSVDSVETFYRDCHLSLSIVLRGTGVKIKVLEALRYGRPVVTTGEGLRGFGAEARDAFPIVDSHRRLAQVLAEMQSDPASLATLARRQREWAERHLDPSTLMKPLLAEVAPGAAR